MTRSKARSRAIRSVVALAGAGLIVAACGGAAAPSADPSSRRSPPAGELEGASGPLGGHVWRGIPFAAPPVGEARWRAPRPPKRWDGVREALASGSLCPQLASRFGGDDSASPGEPVGEEDCLWLDVYAPHFAPGKVPGIGSGLPVMVWIHGGGNVIGSARYYDGERLATEHGVVIVAIQYRLGPLGWFRHTSLRAAPGGAEDRSGNFGTLDQIRALEWVRDNIAAFGGDPSRITIFGESAGGRDVFALLISPRARGLFQRAIVQSGGTETLDVVSAENFVDDPPPGHRNSSNEILLRLLQEDGADDREEALAELAEMSPTRVADYLRDKDPDEILEAYATEHQEGLIDVPQLFRDGRVLPSGDPLQLASRPGGAAGVPVILGSNRDENRLFMVMNPRWVKWHFGVLPRLIDERSFLATAEHLSRSWKVTGVDDPATRLRRVQGASVFAYRWDWDEEPTLLWLADLSKLLGAAHGLEIPFVFGHWRLGSSSDRLFDASNEAGREELSAKMRSYWAQFAATGNPGKGRSGELPEWTPWSLAPGAPTFAVLDTERDGGVRMETGTLTREDVLAGVESDARLRSQRERCEVYWRMARWGRLIDAEDYASAGSEGCADFPFDDPPWSE